MRSKKTRVMSRHIQHSLYEKMNYWATYILALVAILGFIISIESSHETSSNLKKLEQSLSSFTTPVFYFLDYTWLGDYNIDCANPPVGINISYKNGSNIPITIREAELRIYRDNILLNSLLQTDSTSFYYGTESSIIAPGEIFSSSQIDSSKFKEVFNNNGKSNSNFIKVSFSAKVSNINNTSAYHLEYIHYLSNNCSDLNKKQFTTVKEVLTPIATE